MTGLRPRRSVQLLVAVGGLLLLGAAAAAATAAAAAAADSSSSNRRARNPLEALAAKLRLRLEQATNRSDQLDLVFLIDASNSVGEANFRGELNFARKLLSHFTMGPTATRVSIVTFAGKGQLVRHVDHVSREASQADKCRLLSGQLAQLGYSGGGTYTYGALVEAVGILERSRRRESAEKVVLLVTDGFSNGGDPRHAASLLKGLGVTIFSFGIRTGNVQELRDIASAPSHAHSYFLNSFAEFEALARQALHRDLRAGVHALVSERAECQALCQGERRVGAGGCCDPMASCGCGTSTGHYACICPLGYFGSGLAGSCQPCPNGTYGQQIRSDDLSVWCAPCPDANHVTLRLPAISSRDCVCASGFTGERGNCEAITCLKLKVPDNGYFVKANDCNNVINAACGIRCRIGFQLIGDSIRLCGQGGSWSGVETQCLLKTCAALRAPVNGRIRCELEHANNRSKVSDRVAHPIDTRCQFQCKHGFQLRGSKVRNCLPLARWDGLKATCKPIHCEPLKAVANAEIQPKSCMGPRKLPYASNCMITCRKGYKLEGPRTRVCVGRHGTWSKRHSVSRCIDKTRPVLVCPESFTVATLPAHNYTNVDWPLPNVTDNSGVDCNVWSKPYVTFPWKVHVGKHVVKYIAQDVSGNRARCTFNVIIVDREPPVIENCYIDQLSTNLQENILKNYSSWVEPVIYDNSGLPVKVTKVVELNAQPNFVAYTAVDKYGNSAECIVNLTIKHTCDDIDVPKPLNGYAECKSIANGGKECILFCNDGYDFAFEGNLRMMKNAQGYVLTCDATNHSWNSFTPDCSRQKVPSIIHQEGHVVLTGDSVDCDNTTLLNDLAKAMNDSYNRNYAHVCGNDVTCYITYEMNCNTFSARLTRNVDDDVYVISEVSNQDASGHEGKRIEKVRRWKDQIELKFRFIAKIIEDNQNNRRLGVAKLRESIESMSKSGELNLLDEETNKEIGWLALNLHSVFEDPQVICEAGSVPRKNNCVECPAGTFHNQTGMRCQSCPLGEFQSSPGSVACDKCAPHYYTRRLHAKSMAECVAACEPGHYSRGRSHQQHADLAGLALAPCTSCEIGSYQPRYGRSQCLPCPRNGTTETRAATALSDCLPASRRRIHFDFCSSALCANRASCSNHLDGFSCECRPHYVGSSCETFVDPCLSSPCSSAGQCMLTNNSDGDWTYGCLCKPGFAGSFCETLVNECSYSPCRNGATCSATDIDLSCTCADGFEGDFCELAVNQCEHSPCEINSSTCRTIDGSWKCFCKPGYLGLRCDLLPCDWLPCHPNEICVNLFQENANQSSYRCECPRGFTGKDCFTKIDHCQSNPCQHNGTCINNLLDYKCHCHIPFTGSNCEIEMLSDYIMHFTQSGTRDYVTLPGPAYNLTELTVCFWMQSLDTFNYGTVFSYATPNQDNALTLTDYSGFVFYVNGEWVITDARLNDGHWHFVCVVWENQLGSWRLYVDGIQKDSGTLLAKGTQIQAKGTLIFGQEQDEVGGGFSESESFLGKLYLLDIWDKAYGSEVIYDLSNTCKQYHGSLISWVQLQGGIRGDIKLTNSSFCQRCPPPISVFKGLVNISKELEEATHYCETGYEFRKGYERIKTIKKKCMKHGSWAGPKVPNCVRVNCPYPGYFLRGQIRGRSYLYADKIIYTCNDGYKLKGNLERVCTAEGTWSGTAPFCVGITCKNLLAPDHGDFDYIVAEHDRDDLSILQVGQQLEFKCDAGYFLSGNKILTCLQNGTWNFQQPLCLPMNCSPPNQFSHNHIITNITTHSSSQTHVIGDLNNKQSANKSHYFYGNILVFACKQGYKFESDHYISTDLKLECTSNGTWAGLVPACIPLRCPPPIRIENAITYSLDEGQQTIDGTWNNNKAGHSSHNNINDTGIEIENEMYARVGMNYTFGQQIKIICKKGFEIVGGSTIRTCTENETWSDSDVNCEPSQCLFTELNNHPLIRIFSNHTQKLEQRFQVLEVNLDVLNHIRQEFSFHVEGFNYGNKIIIQCLDHKDNKFSNKTQLKFIWECEETKKWKFSTENLYEPNVTNRILKEQINVCSSKRCSALNPPLHGYIEYENNTENAFEGGLIFKCDSGYKLIGGQKSYCLFNGTWTSIPICQPITCGTPPKVLHAQVKSGNIEISQASLGTTISYQCIAGYRIFGQLKLQCLASGVWSRVTGSCARISCGKPQLTGGASIQGNSYFYQDRLIYICPDKKFRDFIICNRDGNWSNFPKCTS
ncbi:sushi, von Willebrand factor type A, EGF and pentraxin domain-containing protein 1-like [Phymastichus coffea]|uniref:sushi, von Willebrand factor type A, EGF and pentraxin domain-containing protein 1-like n=1 Tax=Phymastichus coffea TaxID=108790 RepID=UPI00273B3385|nr:sushi, von Willebrand factor type A, EGF and pentraxin domain-containing protein 1-like [Phymastichus coffea]